MPTLVDLQLARQGKTRADVKGSSAIAKALRDLGVADSPEFERILALPRRSWEDNPQLEFLQESLTEWLKVPGGEQALWPLQAAALSEAHDHGGLLGDVPCGLGKTLITRLAPLVLKAERPILLVPAGLKDKTFWEFDALDKHWQFHGELHVVSYQYLSRNPEWLMEHKPDLIECDEVQFLRNPNAAVTKRVGRYLEAYPDTPFIGLSGTVAQRHLADFHHLLQWSLGPEKSPLPRTAAETAHWGLAVDEKPRGVRVQAGALSAFTPGVKEPTRQQAREGWGARFRETPGVVGAEGAEVDASLRGEILDVRLSSRSSEALKTLRDKRELPNGDLVASPADLWRHARELVCGFYYKWRYPAPELWLKRRRAWNKFVFNTISGGVLDTPSQVETACRRGQLHCGRLLQEWDEVRGSFKPETVPVWLDTELLEDIVDGLEDEEPTIVWVSHTAVGEKLAELSGWPYFGRKGKDAQGRFIEKVEPQHVVASISANHAGRNLQFQWARNLVLMPPSLGDTWEQMLARTHRFGQEAHEVTFDVVIGDESVRAGMEQAIRDAKFTQAIKGGSQQRLLLSGLTVNPFFRDLEVA